MVNGKNDCVAVLARFNEQNHRWKELIERRNLHKVIVYDKGEDTLPGSIKLKNFGREGHTYLHYIIENYNNLPKEILFSQYDPIDHFYCNNIFGKSPAENMKHFLCSDIYDFMSIRPTDYDLLVRGRYMNWEEYYPMVMPEINSKEAIKEIILLGANINGVFRVTRKAILRRSIGFYKNAISFLDKGIDPLFGYFFERAWKAIFSNWGNHDEDDFDNSVYMIGSHTWIDDELYSKETPFDSGFVPFKTQWKVSGAGYLYFHKGGTIQSIHRSINTFTSEDFCYWTKEKNILKILDGYGCVSAVFDLNKTKEEKYKWFGDRINQGRLTNKAIKNYYFLKDGFF